MERLAWPPRGVLKRASHRVGDARTEEPRRGADRCNFQRMQTWETISGPGTIDDLVADAHRAGHTRVNARLVNSWIPKGLLDHPQRRPRGRLGSDKALHSANQRKLFLILLDKRRDLPSLASLAQVPLAYGRPCRSIEMRRVRLAVHQGD